MPTTLDATALKSSESIQEHLNGVTDEMMLALPAPVSLTSEERRSVIARYSSVLEGNFIYWMTGAYLASRTTESRDIITENLLEEVRECHPGMMRRFAVAAHAVPGEADAEIVYANLSRVREFVGRLSAPSLLTMMAFFEGFIQRFMPYLAECAREQGSNEREYTDVHSVCDIGHSQELFRALDAELSVAAPGEDEDLLEGVQLLQALIRDIVAAA